MIGVFDSGFGGLTVLASLLEALPQYDYLFLADSARAPYGARSFDVIYDFTLESVEWLFDEGCTVVILACNTASTRALRNIQQLHLPARRPDRRVLGVVRPSVEALAGLPPGAVPGETPPSLATGIVAVLGTEGTVASDSYGMELRKLAPRLELIQQACPLWAPLGRGRGTRRAGHRMVPAALSRSGAGTGPPAATPVAGCTHFPLLLPGIRRIVPPEVEILAQGEIVASRFAAWLARHPDQEARLGPECASPFRHDRRPGLVRGSRRAVARPAAASRTRPPAPRPLGVCRTLTQSAELISRQIVPSAESCVLRIIPSGNRSKWPAADLKRAGRR
jgi:glutamate racemase